MPILIGTVTPEGPTPTLPPPPLPRNVEPGARLLYYPPSGEPLVLTGEEQGFEVMAVTGFGTPPAELVTLDLPSGGSILQSVRVLSRQPTVTLSISGETKAQIRDRCRQVALAFSGAALDTTGVPLPGTLLLQHPDGRARELQAWYVDGLEDLDSYASLTTWPYRVETVLRLLCPDPFWQGAPPVVLEQTIEVASSKPLVPDAPDGTFPVEMGAGSIIGEDFTVTNDGDAETYPIWTIVGPASGATIRNWTTDKEWVLGRSLTAGEVLTVDTRPTKLTVSLADGTDVWPDLTATSTLWPLAVGEQVLRWDIPGAAGGTRVRMTYQPRHRTS